MIVKKKIAAIFRVWPLAVVVAGAALTIVWVGALIWVLLTMLGLSGV
jgi:hypothetical protein